MADDYRSAFFGLTGQYPTDVQQDEAESYAARLAGSPFERLAALASWVSGANIAGGVPGPRYGGLQIARVKPSANLAPEQVSRGIRGMGREVMQFLRRTRERPVSVTDLRPELKTGRGHLGGYVPELDQVRIDPSASPFEKARVLAHEFGHVAEEALPQRALEELRSATRAVAQSPEAVAEVRHYPWDRQASELFARTRESPYSKLVLPSAQAEINQAYRRSRGILRSMLRTEPPKGRK